jgi:hypothetical protein
MDSKMIDCHILTLPDTRKDWLDDCIQSLSHAHLRLHLMPGASGHIGQGRALGLRAGHAPFVTFADPDDIYPVDAFEALLSTLNADKSRAWGYTAEQRMSADGRPIGPVALPRYDGKVHKRDPKHVHGLVVMRREALTEAILTGLSGQRYRTTQYLTLELARTAGPPATVDAIGRYWRQHQNQAHRGYGVWENRRCIYGK